MFTKINYECYSKFDANEYNNIKDNYKVNLDNIFYITSNIKILSCHKIVDDNLYSFVNEDFCNKLKIKYENNDKAYYYLNKGERFVYFSNQKKLLKVKNYNNNEFFLSKPEPQKLYSSIDINYNKQIGNNSRSSNDSANKTNDFNLDNKYNNIIEIKNKEIKMLKDELNKSEITIEKLNDKIQDLQAQLTIAKNSNNSYLNKIKELENKII